MFSGFKTPTNLVILDIKEFDIIWRWVGGTLIMLFLIIIPKPSLQHAQEREVRMRMYF